METVGSKVQALHHVTLPVSDLGRAEQFYVGVLGAEVVRRRNEGGPGEHISIVLGGSVRIDLFPSRKAFLSPGQPTPGEGSVGHPHVAFSVAPGDLTACAESLRRQGVGCEGPVRQGPPGTASVYFDDPDGNHLEIETDGFPEDQLLRIGTVERQNLEYAWPQS